MFFRQSIARSQNKIYSRLVCLSWKLLTQNHLLRKIPGQSPTKCDIRAVIRYLAVKGKNASKNFNEVKIVYGNCPLHAWIQKTVSTVASHLFLKSAEMLIYFKVQKFWWLFGWNRENVKRTHINNKGHLPGGTHWKSEARDIDWGPFWDLPYRSRQSAIGSRVFRLHLYDWTRFFFPSSVLHVFRFRCSAIFFF